MNLKKTFDPVTFTATATLFSSMGIGMFAMLTGGNLLIASSAAILLISVELIVIGYFSDSNLEMEDKTHGAS